MQSSPLQVALLVYAVGVLVTAWLTSKALQAVRESDDESPEMQSTLASIDKLCDATGLRDSGVAVMIGLMWPAALMAYLLKPR